MAMPTPLDRSHKTRKAKEKEQSLDLRILTDCHAKGCHDGACGCANSKIMRVWTEVERHHHLRMGMKTRRRT